MYIRKRVKRKKRIKSKKINRNVDFYDVLFDVLFSIYIVGQGKKFSQVEKNENYKRKGEGEGK